MLSLGKQISQLCILEACSCCPQLFGRFTQHLPELPMNVGSTHAATHILPSEPRSHVRLAQPRDDAHTLVWRSLVVMHTLLYGAASW
jgi:hypothetical protein